MRPSVVELSELNEKITKLQKKKLSLNEFMNNVNAINRRTEEKVAYLEKELVNEY